VIDEGDRNKPGSFSSALSSREQRECSYSLGRRTLSWVNGELEAKICAFGVVILFFFE